MEKINSIMIIGLFFLVDRNVFLVDNNFVNSLFIARSFSFIPKGQKQGGSFIESDLFYGGSSTSIKVWGVGAGFL